MHKFPIRIQNQLNVIRPGTCDEIHFPLSLHFINTCSLPLALSFFWLFGWPMVNCKFQFQITNSQIHLKILIVILFVSLDQTVFL